MGYFEDFGVSAQVTSLGLNLSSQRTDGGDFVIKYFMGRWTQQSKNPKGSLHIYTLS